MWYVPAFFETFLVLVVALVVLAWVRRRSPAAGIMAPLLVAGVGLSTLWGAAAVWAQSDQDVNTSRYAAMAIALVGLLVAIGWAAAVRGKPPVDPDQPA